MDKFNTTAIYRLPVHASALPGHKFQFRFFPLKFIGPQILFVSFLQTSIGPSFEKYMRANIELVRLQTTRKANPPHGKESQVVCT